MDLFRYWIDEKGKGESDYEKEEREINNTTATTTTNNSYEERRNDIKKRRCSEDPGETAVDGRVYNNLSFYTCLRFPNSKQ